MGKFLALSPSRIGVMGWRPGPEVNGEMYLQTDEPLRKGNPTLQGREGVNYITDSFTIVYEVI